MKRITIVCLLFVACASSRVPSCYERMIDEAVATPLAEQRFAGVVLVARDGRAVVRKAYGLAER